MENLNNQHMNTQKVKQTRRHYRWSEVQKMKELIRTGFSLKEIAEAYHEEFDVPLENFRQKLYSLSKATRKKRKIDGNPETVIGTTMVKGRNSSSKSTQTAVLEEEASPSVVEVPVNYGPKTYVPKNIEFFEDRIVIHL